MDYIAYGGTWKSSVLDPPAAVSSYATPEEMVSGSILSFK
jgi:hypothetical protein